MNEILNLNAHQEAEIRRAIIETATKLIGIKYETEEPSRPVWAGRGKWLDLSKIPKSLDCSGLVEGCYRSIGLAMPHGSSKQFDFTFPIGNGEAKVGDLAFFGREGKKDRIYHVGLVYDATQIIESRAFDPNVSFETGKAILRPRARWEAYGNFVGYRRHPKFHEQV